MSKSKKNLALIDNFLLHATHMNRGDQGGYFPFTGEELYQMALDYIEEDHVDGKPADEEVMEDLNSVITSCQEGLSGEWDCSTDEGKNGFNDMISLLERVKDYIQ